MDELILVDDSDRAVGTAGKDACHRGPLRHRAFSIMIFNGTKMLITQRSAGKKTWPLFWSNACCSHPRNGEDCAAAAQRRLKEELGFSCKLRFLFKFEYAARYDADWGEHEVDWVFRGEYAGAVTPDEREIADYKFVELAELKEDARRNPDAYTPWFKTILERI